MASRLGRIPATWWAKSAAAGLVGGLVMALVWNVISALLGKGFWTPMNAIGTTMPGTDTISTAFNSFTITGLFLHLLTAFCWGVVYGVVAGVMVPRFARSPGRATLLGLGFGVAVFVLMGLVVGPLVNPRIMAIHPVDYFVGHLVFGAVTGWALYTMTRRRELAVTFSQTARASDRITTIHH